MMTAAFSPMASAVLYVFDPTFSGMILKSVEIKGDPSVVRKRFKNIYVTCHLEVFDAVHI